MLILDNLELLFTIQTEPRSGVTVDVESVDGFKPLPELGLETPDEMHAIVPLWVVANDGRYACSQMIWSSRASPRRRENEVSTVAGVLDEVDMVSYRPSVRKLLENDLSGW